MEIYHPKDEELIIEMKRARRIARRKRVFWGVLAFLVLSSVFGFFVFNRYFTLAVQRPGCHQRRRRFLPDHPGSDADL